MNELIILSMVMGIIINLIILGLLLRFRDLIKISLLFRRELKRRGKLDLNAEKVEKIVDRLEAVNDKFKKGGL